MNRYNANLQIQEISRERNFLISAVFQQLPTSWQLHMLEEVANICVHMG